MFTRKPLPLDRMRQAWHLLSPDLKARAIRTMSIVSLNEIRKENTYRVMVDDELARRWTTTLTQAKLDPTRTRVMMQKTNTILSGSAALGMILPGMYTPSDLDFYCPRRAGAEVTLSFHAEGYRLLPPPSGIRRSYGCVAHGLKYIITMRHKDDPTKKINIIESSTKSPHAPLLFFHSTVVMNFVSAEGYGLFYPSLTATKEGLINRIADHAIAQNLNALAKYVRRGFTLADTCLHDGDHAGQGECIRAIRSTDDAQVLRVPFEIGSDVPVTPRIEWRMGSVGEHTASTVVVLVHTGEGKMQMAL